MRTRFSIFRISRLFFLTPFLTPYLFLVLLFVPILLQTGCARNHGPSSVFVEEPKEDETKDTKLKRQEEIIRRQHQELERQQREIENLQRQRYYNKAFEPHKKK